VHPLHCKTCFRAKKTALGVHDVRSNIPTLQPFSFEGSRAILHKVEKKICIGPEKAHIDEQ
jgi:hypothetical protein